jgi:hypothetical protein
MKWRGGKRGRGIPAFGGIGANASSYIGNFFGEDPIKIIALLLIIEEIKRTKLQLLR